MALHLAEVDLDRQAGDVVLELGRLEMRESVLHEECDGLPEKFRRKGEVLADARPRVESPGNRGVGEVLGRP